MKFKKKKVGFCRSVSLSFQPAGCHLIHEGHYDKSIGPKRHHVCQSSTPAALDISAVISVGVFNYFFQKGNPSLSPLAFIWPSARLPACQGVRLCVWGCPSPQLGHCLEKTDGLNCRSSPHSSPPPPPPLKLPPQGSSDRIVHVTQCATTLKRLPRLL